MFITLGSSLIKKGAEKMISLGDQSPWLGGLLRSKVLNEIGEKTNYFLADTDCPYIKNGSSGILSGWPSYVSVAVRCPWTLDVPGIDKNLAGVIANCLGLKFPPGMQYLAKNTNQSALCFLDKDPKLINLLRKMLDTEVSWVIKTFPDLVKTQVNLNFESIREFVGQLNEMLGIKSPVKSLTDFFGGNPLKLRGVFPSEYFWKIQRFGRTLATGDQPGIIVPRGKIMILELLAQGYELGCTNLPYIGETVKLRDKFMPGFPIKLVRVNFNWVLPNGADPIKEIAERFLSQRKKKISPSDLEALEKKVNKLSNSVQQYWKSRPSVISYLMLGGDLSANITRETL